MILQKVSQVKSGEWDTVCPICGKRIGEFTAPVESYEVECGNCKRWYFLSDSVCKPVGVSMKTREIKEQFIDIASCESQQIQVRIGGPKQRKKKIDSPVLKRMTETLTQIEL